MQIIGIVGFFLAMLILIMGSLRSYNIIVLSLLATATLILTNGMPLYDTFFTGADSWIGGVGGFFSQYFVIFLLSSILARYMQIGGGAQSIANWVLDKTGTDNPYSVLVAIYLISAILSLGGVNMFVAIFVIAPLAKGIFEKLDLPWYLMITPYLMGVASFTSSTFPGSPSVQNVVVGTNLGTPLTAAPFLSIILTVISIVWALYRFKVELKEAKEQGHTFEDRHRDDNQVEFDNLPNPFLSLLPLILLLGTILVGTGMGVDNIIVYALVFSVISAVIIFHKYIPDHQNILNEGAVGSLSTVIYPACAAGFGTVISVSPSFAIILDFLQGLPLSPVLVLVLLTFFLQFVIGAASGVLGIVTDRFVPLFDLANYNMEFVHRMIVLSPSYFPPQVGMLLSIFDITGLTHKEAYGNIMKTVNGGWLILLVAGYLLGNLMY